MIAVRTNDGPALSKSQWAYTTVRTMIVAGELAQGAPLDQQALAAQLGISTTPLREALRRLEAEDFVIGQDHKEMRVASISIEDIEHIYAIRLELDPHAVKLACSKASDAQLDHVRKLLPPATGLSKFEYLVENRDFHRAMYSVSGNRALTRVLDGLWDQCDRFRSGLLDDAEVTHVSNAEHSLMCTLLLARDGEGLADLMRAHLLGSLEQCRRDDPRPEVSASV